MGKFLHELRWATQTPNNALMAISDPDDPFHLRKIRLGDLRTVIRGLPFFEDLPESEIIDNPLWTLEGVEGGWEITFTTIVEDALWYIIFYYDEDLENWRAHPQAVQEVRDVATEPLSIVIPAATALPRLNRRFKIKTITPEAVSELSSEKSAWSKVKCPPGFVPSVPVPDTDGWPLVSTNPAYGVFGLSVTVKFSAATGEADYIDHYELMRQDSLLNGDWPISPLTWRALPTHQVLEDDPNIPPKKTIYYVDDSQMARAGFWVRYRIRAVARNGNKSDWTEPIAKLLVDDTTAPDVPVLTAIQKQLMIHVSFDPPTQAGGPCPDFDYFQLQVKKDSGSFADVPGDGVVVGIDYIFPVSDADIGSTFQFRARAYDKAEPTPNVSAWSTPTTAISAAKVDTNSLSPTVQNTLSQVSTNTSTISSHSTTISQHATAISLKADATTVNTLSGKVSALSSEVNVLAGQVEVAVIADGRTISSFEAGVSGLRLQGASIEITGSTVFSSGYDPSTKLTATGGAYNSAASGARVRIFPDANTGILVTDGTNDVFKALVGGDDVGDVIIGSAAGHRIHWDKSEATMTLRGLLSLPGSGNALMEMAIDGSNPVLRMTDGSDDSQIVSLTTDGENGCLDLLDIWADRWLYARPGSVRVGSDDYSKSAELYGDDTYPSPMLRINGLKVVSVRGDAVADATGAGDVVAQLNALLARIRAHGLIAT